MADAPIYGNYFQIQDSITGTGRVVCTHIGSISLRGWMGVNYLTHYVGTYFEQNKYYLNSLSSIL